MAAPAVLTGMGGLRGLDGEAHGPGSVIVGPFTEKSDAEDYLAWILARGDFIRSAHLIETICPPAEFEFPVRAGGEPMP